MTIFNFIFQSALIVLPIFLAGILFIISLKLDLFPSLKEPVDFGKKWRKKRIFGDNKTFRGFVVMPVATFLTVLFVGIFAKLLNVDTDVVVFDYSVEGSWKALIFGLAYPLGELPNSFIKRQMEVAPGKRLKGRAGRALDFLDKVDSLLLCGIVAFFLYGLCWDYVIGAIALGIILHYLTDFIMVRIGLKKKS